MLDKILGNFKVIFIALFIVLGLYCYNLHCNLASLNEEFLKLQSDYDYIQAQKESLLKIHTEEVNKCNEIVTKLSNQLKIYEVNSNTILSNANNKVSELEIDSNTKKKDIEKELSVNPSIENQFNQMGKLLNEFSNY